MGFLKRRPLQSVRYGEPQHKFFVFVKPLLVLLCCGVLYFVYINWQSWLEKLDDGPITSFALVGTPRYTTNADVREVLLKMGDLKGYFGQDINRLREQVESMPWVKNAVVRKIWPDKLSILVTEYTPAALWNDTEFVSPKGEIFKLPMDKVKIAELPHLSGPNFQSLNVLEAWGQIQKELKAKNMAIKAVAVDERGSWQVTLANDVLLKLGRGEWKSKIERFATIYPQIEVPENQRLSYIDLRYKVGAAVGFTHL